MKVEEFDIGW